MSSAVRATPPVWRRGPVRACGDRDSQAARATVREVCLIGRDRRVETSGWEPGQGVTWMGRRYKVVATAIDPSGPGDGGRDVTPGRHYVHLTSWDAC